MPASRKQPKQRQIKDGSIYTTLSASECHAQDINTNLQGKAWGHPVLVLGRNPVYRNSLRIMTITSSLPDYENTIPFAPLPKDKRHPMQLRLAHFYSLPRNSYLRIDKEYWIEARGLDDEMGRIPVTGCRGLGMLTNLLGKRTMEKVREEQRKVWDKSLKQEVTGLKLQPSEQKVLRLEHQSQDLGNKSLKA